MSWVSVSWVHQKIRSLKGLAAISVVYADNIYLFRGGFAVSNNFPLNSIFYILQYSSLKNPKWRKEINIRPLGRRKSTIGVGGLSRPVCHPGKLCRLGSSGRKRPIPRTLSSCRVFRSGTFEWCGFLDLSEPRSRL